MNNDSHSPNRASPASELSGILRESINDIVAEPLEETDLERMLDHARQLARTAVAVPLQSESEAGSMDSQQPVALKKKIHAKRRLAIFAAAALVLVAAWLGLSEFATKGRGTSAFATTCEQIVKAKTMTWTWEFYEHVTSKNGKSTWRRTEFLKEYYKWPGLRRSVLLDDKGSPERVTIKDTIHGRELTYYPKKKEATLEEFAPWPDDPGPFPVERKALNEPNLQWIGQQRTADGDANGFRYSFRDTDNERDWSRDYWIDNKTKQLVALYVPGADIYDPRNDALDKAPLGLGQQFSRLSVMGGGFVDMCYDVALDASLFRLQPPEGYSITVKPREHVTEKDMIEYWRILAEFNDKTFPDQAFSSGKLLTKINRALKKPRDQQTEAERKLIDTDMRYSLRFGTVTNAPILVFFAWDPDSIIKNSFRYLGNGVKLGNKEAIVCWYKLKDAKAPTTYRVVYGDLSIKDLRAEELPLPVDP